MAKQVELKTKRLNLRQIQLSDSSEIQHAAGNKAIADTMISIPHPYPKSEAEKYVKQSLIEYQSGKSFTFIIESFGMKNFCGIVEIRDIDHEHMQAELSFWLAESSWGKGYMTEILQEVIDFSFKHTDLNRLYAYHMLRNPASGKVLSKNGFVREGVLRQRVYKLGKFEDVAICSLIKDDYKK